MVLKTVYLLNGISALTLFLTGIYYSVRFMLYYRKQKKPLIPLISLMALFLGSFYLGGTTAFLLKEFWGQDLNYIVYGYLAYTLIPFLIVLAVYVSYEIFNPKMKWKVTIFYFITGIVYLIALYGWPTVMLSATTPGPDELMDSSIHSVILILSIFYIFSLILLLGTQFFALKKRLKDEEPKKKAQQQGLGWILFGIGGIMDTAFPLELIIITRIIMLIGYIYIFKGFSPLKTNEIEKSA